MPTSTSTQILYQKASKKTPTFAVNNTVNKLILDRGGCEKLHKKLRFADPVFITSGIYLNGLSASSPIMLFAKQNEAESSHF